jgi:hypothetical protein
VSGAAVPEPPPVANDGASMHDLVIADMAERKQFGLDKYGTVLQAGNGRKALWDAYQEVLDLAVYLRQKIEEDARDAVAAAPAADGEPEHRCERCGEPMPEGERMFRYHGYSGPCPKDGQYA